MGSGGRAGAALVRAAAAPGAGRRPAASVGSCPGLRPGQGMNIGQVGPGQPLDTATARMLGLPTAPTRNFPEPDSVLTELLKRTGYKVHPLQGGLGDVLRR